MARLGGRFAMEVADILQKLSEKRITSAQQTLQIDHKKINQEVLEHQAFALARLRAKNVSGAIEYIERHVPDLRQWLDGQIKHFIQNSRVGSHSVISSLKTHNVSNVLQNLCQMAS